MAKDLFSGQAALYAQYRPVYPLPLYEYILSFVKNKQAAWDCATGNGQAAAVLAGHFEKVCATDISEQQLQQAVQRENIQYSAAPAEQTPFPDHSFDCITVAQAYHWFNFAAFHREVVRVAKPGAVIAVWGYGLAVCEEGSINEQFLQFYRHTTGPYWDKERKYVDDQYTTVPFPYHELPAKNFSIGVQWTKDHFRGYLNTWSAVQHFIKANGYNPVDEFMQLINELFPPGKPYTFHFPVFLRLGIV